MCSVRSCVHLLSNSKLKWIYKKPQKPSPSLSLLLSHKLKVVALNLSLFPMLRHAGVHLCICLCNFRGGGSVRRKTGTIQTRAICLLHITFNYYCIKQRQGFSLPKSLRMDLLVHSLARSHTPTYNKKQTSNQMFNQNGTQKQQQQQQ